LKLQNAGAERSMDIVGLKRSGIIEDRFVFAVRGREKKTAYNFLFLRRLPRPRFLIRVFPRDVEQMSR